MIRLDEVQGNEGEHIPGISPLAGAFDPASAAETKADPLALVCPFSPLSLADRLLSLSVTASKLAVALSAAITIKGRKESVGL